MNVDEQRLHLLIEESQDQQSDAMRDAKAVLPDLRDIASDRRKSTIITPDEIRALEASRVSTRAKLGMLAGAGAIGVAVSSLLASPVAADEALDIQILQTAASLEILAVATYGAALTLPFIVDGNAIVKAFAEMTMMQHDEHRQAFQAQCKALGGAIQENPNPKYKPIVDAAVPTLTDAAKVVDLAATLEQVATETYLADLNMFTDKTSLGLMASVMGVESQHLAVLRAVGALLAGGGEALIAIPTDVAALPAAAGSVSFPDAFQGTTMASPPKEGAL
ncbi:MAG: ferritin-like domain-containing protein [Ilumatobacteraceae bacterium]